MSKFDEQIIVVPREKLFNHEELAFNGFISHKDKRGEAIYNHLKAFEVKRRGDMEEDPSFKQLITYTLIENEKGELLVYERLTGGGEARLHGQQSIGVGGHMNDVEGAESIEVIVRENAGRELNEEIGIHPQQLDHIGFINDDNNEVGRVHMGVVYKVKVNQEEVDVKETDTLKIKWQSIDEINQFDTFESWSALILKNLK
ncbi:NUDIX domain-containing protein [Staphylococcus canis]|uniref:NUDIX domain-containing protein n=1 Tax=Staphylococcus canis TaxID=2724942 RepID=A0ABS0T632_9STAP|nr:NUDIX domain-containing protein [Staphylococcus canis]MBI5974206.1 NUDIX domain-containing protein [Staphylococcus canis]